MMDGGTVTTIAICATVAVSMIAASVSSILSGGKQGNPAARVAHMEEEDVPERSSSKQVTELAQQIAALKSEVAQLRETATQYDLSIQHTLDETQHRLAALESRRRVETAVPSPVEERRQSLGG